MKTTLPTFNLANLCLILLLTVFVPSAFAKIYPDRTTAPLYSAASAEVVGEFAHPPGNVTVTSSGRVFLTFHPVARPDTNVGELIIFGNGGGGWHTFVEPFPRKSPEKIHSVLSIRADRQNRIWLLDYGHFGLFRPKLLAFDADTQELVHSYKFSNDIAGFGSMLNDFHVSKDGRFIFIADNSIFAAKPGVIVYDTQTKSARKVLTKHPSLVNHGYKVRVDGKPMFGSNWFHGLDPIALDRTDTYLYFGALNGDLLYRVPVAALLDKELPPAALESLVEPYSTRTMSDGISIDDNGGIYLSDIEHSAIVRVETNGTLTTLLKNPRFRWPDGFSFGPDGWLYFTTSALHETMLKSKKAVRKKGPYQLYRFRPGAVGFPGH